jgi:hypothetical protein
MSEEPATQTAGSVDARLEVVAADSAAGKDWSVARDSALQMKGVRR